MLKRALAAAVAAIFRPTRHGHAPVVHVDTGSVPKTDAPLSVTPAWANDLPPEKPKARSRKKSSSKKKSVAKKATSRKKPASVKKAPRRS